MAVPRLTWLGLGLGTGLGIGLRIGLARDDGGAAAHHVRSHAAPAHAVRVRVRR